MSVSSFSILLVCFVVIHFIPFYTLAQSVQYSTGKKDNRDGNKYLDGEKYSIGHKNNKVVKVVELITDPDKFKNVSYTANIPSWRNIEQDENYLVRTKSKQVDSTDRIRAKKFRRHADTITGNQLEKLPLVNSENNQAKSKHERGTVDEIGDGSARKSTKVGKSIKDKSYVLKKKIEHVARTDKANAKWIRSKREAILPTSRLNVNSDYYAQRKAVMDRFYARQREIAEKYARRNSTRPTALPYNQTNTRNVTYQNSNSRNQQRVNNSIALPINTLADDLKVNPGYDRETYKTNYDPNNIRNFYRPSRNCNGTECEYDDGSQDEDEYSYGESDSSTTASQSNGEQLVQKFSDCSGKVVYYHNLETSVTGPSNLDVLFEVTIQGPVCITCITIHRSGSTAANEDNPVQLERGGRGYQYAIIRLKGQNNRGFGYIIRAWGVKKREHDCKYQMES